MVWYHACRSERMAVIPSLIAFMAQTPASERLTKAFYRTVQQNLYHDVHGSQPVGTLSVSSSFVVAIVKLQSHYYLSLLVTDPTIHEYQYISEHPCFTCEKFMLRDCATQNVLSSYCSSSAGPARAPAYRLFMH